MPADCQPRRPSSRCIGWLDRFVDVNSFGVGRRRRASSSRRSDWPDPPVSRQHMLTPLSMSAYADGGPALVGDAYVFRFSVTRATDNRHIPAPGTEPKISSELTAGRNGQSIASAAEAEILIAIRALTAASPEVNRANAALVKVGFLLRSANAAADLKAAVGDARAALGAI